MIQNFEDYSANISYEEEEIAKLMAKLFKKEKDNAITSKQIKHKLFELGYVVSLPNVRRYIQWIRVTNEVKMLCASQKGYYIAENEEEWTRYRIAFRSRITSMQFTLSCMN